MRETSLIPAPVAAQYVATFLKPEMLHLYRQIRALRAFRPVVLCQRREHAEEFPFEPVVVTGKPRTHQLRRFWQKTILHRPITIYRREAERLEARLRELDAKVLHVYFGHIGVYLLPLLQQTTIPTIVSFHGADAQVEHERASYRERQQGVFQAARLILVRSHSIAARLEAVGCPPKKIRLHRTGIPLEEVAFTPRTPPLDGAWRCVQACRLIGKKGLPAAVRAFARFSERYPLSTFTIAGEGPLLPELQSLAAELGLRDRIFFPGFLPQSTLQRLFGEAHLFLHPSELGPNGDQEGVPNSMLEAMASGLPVVATRHGGIPEAVEHGRSGLLVAERDWVALAEAMLSLAADPALYRAMNAAAAQRVVAEFDTQRQARLLESLYTEALTPL